MIDDIKKIKELSNSILKESKKKKSSKKISKKEGG